MKSFSQSANVSKSKKLGFFAENKDEEFSGRKPNIFQETHFCKAEIINSSCSAQVQNFSQLMSCVLLSYHPVFWPSSSYF